MFDLSMNLNGANVLVTGGAGHIGSHLVEYLIRQGSTVRVADNLERGRIENIQHVLDKVDFRRIDLRLPKNCDEAVQNIDIVFHLAAKLGGIEYMNADAGSQAEIYDSNILMNTLMLDAARRGDVDRYLYCSTACVYPVEKQDEPNVPALKEEDAYPANPESTYAWAKLMGEIQAKWYAKEHGMKTSTVRMFNVYAEHEDLNPRTAHVIPALVRKAVLYPKVPFIVYGTGNQTRSFLYADDAVRGMVSTCDKISDGDVVNIGSEQRITIRQLAEKIVKISGKDINLTFDPSKPSGAMGRAANWEKAGRLLGWRPSVPMEDGLSRFYDWAQKTLMSVSNMAEVAVKVQSGN
jgi:nucleoside-diphosphate-sugar epimerase